MTNDDEEHTPTTDEVRQGFIDTGYGWVKNGHLTHEFNRWLATVQSAAFRAGVKAQKNHARAVSTWRMSDTSDPRPSFSDPYSSRPIQ